MTTAYEMLFERAKLEFTTRHNLFFLTQHDMEDKATQYAQELAFSKLTQEEIQACLVEKLDYYYTRTPHDAASIISNAMYLIEKENGLPYGIFTLEEMMRHHLKDSVETFLENLWYWAQRKPRYAQEDE